MKILEYESRIKSKGKYLLFSKTKSIQGRFNGHPYMLKSNFNPV